MKEMYKKKKVFVKNRKRLVCIITKHQERVIFSMI